MAGKFTFGLQNNAELAEALRVMAYQLEHDEVVVKGVITSSTRVTDDFETHSFTLQYCQRGEE